MVTENFNEGGGITHDEEGKPENIKKIEEIKDNLELVVEKIKILEEEKVKLTEELEVLVKEAMP